MTTSASRRRYRAMLGTVALASALGTGAANAQDAARIAELERQLAALAAEVQALKAAQAQAPATAVRAPATGGGAAAAQLTPDQLPRPVVQTPPSPGIAGQPFYAELPQGRTTGVLATGNDKVRLTFSGQINRALNVIDDGVDTETYHVDNENASSRFRFLGETSPLNETQAVSLFEFEWPTNASLDVNQLDQTVSDSLEKVLNLRLLEVGFANPTWGSIFLGQGWTASDGTSEIDISGITTPAWAGQTFAFGGMLPTADGGPFDYVPRNPDAVPVRADFATNADYKAALAEFGSDPANFVNIFSLGNGLDGLSRAERVRYNTPIFGGFQVSASYGPEGVYDAALRYGGNASWGRFAAAASYWTNDESDANGGFEGYTGSASLLLTSDTGWWDGLSFTVSAATQDFGDGGRSDPETYFGKIGYVTDIWDFGRTGFAVMYGNYDEFRTFDEEMDLYTLAFSQNIDALGAELYAGYTWTSFDSDVVDYNDMSMLQLGAMVRF